MGITNSKIEEDKALQMCRERKKFVRQALDGRCALAAAHVDYIQSLEAIGIALRRFVEPEAPNESSLYTSTSATPEPLALTEKGSYSRKVEEKPSLPVMGTVTSSTSSLPPSTPPWDFFHLFPSVDNQFSSQGGELNQGLDTADDITQLRKEEGIPELEDEEDKVSFHGEEESQDSEDEFDEPSTDTLVRKKSNSPGLSPLRSTSSAVALHSDVRSTPVKENGIENKVAPKDFFSSIRDIEYLFVKASESGKEVPRMLEANKFHFRPIFPQKDSGSVTSTLFKACFSCGEDPTIVQEEPAQAAMKYLTWHRTASSRSSSSRNPLGSNSKDDIEDLTSNLFDNFCMTSGSHASTLDRLFAWERKLYDEVKASEMIRRDYDMKCKILRQLESKGESTNKIDKTRAVVKDLHSRIRVAIHRINSISKRIEELRDTELEPQLEELISGEGKWRGGVGLSEKGGSTAFNGCKHVCVDAHTQGNIGLFCEGPSNLLSPRMDCALKENERSEPKSFWEVGESSKGAERVLDPVRAFLDEPLKKGRASVFQMLSKGWFAEEFLVGGMGFEEIEGVLGSFSPADACLMDEASRHSFVSPSFVCVWGGQDSSSSPFSRVERALIEVEEGHDADVILKENKRELSVNPLSVLLVKSNVGGDV
ncbi:unnamed protein product, partial [Vitis vinifera]